jgi:hypothetical protein
MTAGGHWQRASKERDTWKQKCDTFEAHDHDLAAQLHASEQRNVQLQDRHNNVQVQVCSLCATVATEKMRGKRRGC